MNCRAEGLDFLKASLFSQHPTGYTCGVTEPNCKVVKAICDSPWRKK
jgi:hypothetical protein